MWNEWISSPLFGIVLSILAFEIGLWLNRRLGSPVANPLLIAVILVILVLQLFRIPLESFQKGGEVISTMLVPATAALALLVYRQLPVLRENFLPVVLGCLAGSVTSMVSVAVCCRLLGLDEVMTASLLPKSVTTPIAMEVSASHGGLVPITVVAVILTGIMGAICAPLLIRLFHVKDPVEAGVSIGACSHAVGTTRALEMGELEGAMSGVSIGISGLMTVLLSLLY
ncbi:LrgB family protein [Angelakisella massiliensis]|uniref:LrgB family protein n=1 Tax=Angelakisella massiliensis TaxID=1871018 RepID=UPI0023A8A224|nr:LrgB family protein [Angelakisella massiliensis]